MRPQGGSSQFREAEAGGISAETVSGLLEPRLGCCSAAGANHQQPRDEVAVDAAHFLLYLLCGCRPLVPPSWATLAERASRTWWHETASIPAAGNGKRDRARQCVVRRRGHRFAGKRHSPLKEIESASRFQRNWTRARAPARAARVSPRRRTGSAAGPRQDGHPRR